MWYCMHVVNTAATKRYSLGYPFYRCNKVSALFPNIVHLVCGCTRSSKARGTAVSTYKIALVDMPIFPHVLLIKPSY